MVPKVWIAHSRSPSGVWSTTVAPSAYAGALSAPTTAATNSATPKTIAAATIPATARNNAMRRAYVAVTDADS
ncbi:hypothetical protein NN3_56510 [Nocardia neocaledoniensis NBRC 108232]|nr:hypothetical protein NN3_56510 [Nocardia neocaledoniensis NBRC 108232]